MSELLTKDSAFALATKDSGVRIEVKDLNDDGEFEGYGSIFGNKDSYGEVVEPGAFGESLVLNQRGERSIKLLWQHNSMEPIGVWTDLAEDKKGLYAKGRLLVGDVQRATEAHRLLKAKALDGLSIGYRIPAGGAEWDDKARVLRLKKIDLKEISIVTFAANERARVTGVKQMLETGRLPSLDQFEGFLREAGLSKSQAAVIVTRGYAHLLRGEPGEDGAKAAEAIRLVQDLGLDTLLTAGK